MMPFILQVGGLALLGLVAAQLTVLLMSSLRGLAVGRSIRGLELEILQQRLAIARLQLRKQEESPAPWNGFRKFRIGRKVLECEGVCSLYLAPHDNKPLPPFKPGQFLTFEIHLPGQSKPLVRCYSLSDRPRPDFYRITVKRIPPLAGRPDFPPGVVSDHIVSTLREGDILDVRAPAGHFHLDLEHERPLVLIAGGVGITPVLSMLNEIVDSGSKRETWLFYGVRNTRDHIMKSDLETMVRGRDHVHLHVCYSDSGPEDVPGTDFHHAGRVTIELLKKKLPSSNYHFYICGPGPMMKDIPAGLREWNVPDAHIRTEAFQSDSVKTLSAKPEHPQPMAGIPITFARSEKTMRWPGQGDSLLEFAESAGVAIDSGCRAGSCGTCKTAIKSGKVTYLKPPSCEVEAGSCLTCICIPETEVVLDA